MDPALIWLWKRIEVCQAFPVYRLDELRDTPARELLLALKLIETARKALS